jgi:hypothetical protein
MRRLIPLGLMTLLLFLASPLGAQDVTGTWELSWETPRGTRTTTVALVQEGSKVTGTATMQRMGRPGGSGGGLVDEIVISDGTMEGDQLSFALTLERGGRTFSQSFTATVTGDTMEGTVTTPMGENPFSGEKVEG